MSENTFAYWKRPTKRLLLRSVASVPKSIDELMNDAEAMLAEEASVGIPEGLPNISVGSEEQPKDVIAVTFTQPVPELKIGTKPDRNGKYKEFAWINVTVLHPHEGYDGKSKKAVKLKKGDKASMNLKRHANLWAWAKQALQAQETEEVVDGKIVKKTTFNGSLDKRSFIIGTMGIVKTGKGNKAFDYRVKEVTGVQ